MPAYTVRFKIVEIMLFYPNTVKDNQDHSGEFFIEDELADRKQINIRSIQLSILNKEMFEIGYEWNKTLKEMFEATTKTLITEIKSVLLSYINYNYNILTI